MGKENVPSVHTVLVVAPDPELRRSIAFALEAEGFGIDAHVVLSSALRSPGAATAACTVVDENAIAGRNGAGEPLDAIARPVVLLVDRLRALPQTAGIRVLTKPLLGRLLVDTVAGAIADGEANGRAK